MLAMKGIVVNSMGEVKVGVIGAGSWGTALANLLANKGVDITLWVREDEVHQQIKNERMNRVFLPGVELSARLRSVKTFQEALSDRDLVLVVVPSHVFREVLGKMKYHMGSGIPIVAATKGIENDTLMTMSEVAANTLSGISMKDYACLSGPSFAKEVCKKSPTAVTIACEDLKHAEKLQQLFSTEFFRVYISKDVVGVQLGGALKNVIAIAAGVVDGLNFGHNARAALITRGLAEIARLGVAMGANPQTFAGLAGMGDLVLTCTGDMSRNRTVGLRIAQGMDITRIATEMKMVAEGIKTTRSAYELGRKMGVEMPITKEVYHILYDGKDPRIAVKDLMTRELKAELEH